MPPIEFPECLREPQAEVYHHRTLVPRDELSPDELIEHLYLSVRALERDAEERGVALDWETFRFKIAVQGFNIEFAPKNAALLMSDVAVLS